jgi:hypothetical protein
VEADAPFQLAGKKIDNSMANQNLSPSAGAQSTFNASAPNSRQKNRQKGGTNRRRGNQKTNKSKGKISGWFRRSK